MVCVSEIKIPLESDVWKKKNSSNPIYIQICHVKMVTDYEQSVFVPEIEIFRVIRKIKILEIRERNEKGLRRIRIAR